MAVFNITEAKAQLSAIIQKVVDEGEDAIISKAGRPVARLTRFEAARKKRKLDTFRGKITISDDFNRWPDDVARSLGVID